MNVDTLRDAFIFFTEPICLLITTPRYRVMFLPFVIIVRCVQCIGERIFIPNLRKVIMFPSSPPCSLDSVGDMRGNLKFICSSQRREDLNSIPRFCLFCKRQGPKLFVAGKMFRAQPVLVCPY